MTPTQTLPKKTRKKSSQTYDIPGLERVLLVLPGIKGTVHARLRLPCSVEVVRHEQHEVKVSEGYKFRMNTKYTALPTRQESGARSHT